MTASYRYAAKVLTARPSPPLTEEIRGPIDMRPNPVPTPRPVQDGLVAPPVACWYADRSHWPTVGWCPTSCNGAATHTERARNGDQLVYCEAHAYWRRKTTRLRLVRRMRPGEQPEPLRRPHGGVSSPTSPFRR
jgi:hypothetical protein